MLYRIQTLYLLISIFIYSVLIYFFNFYLKKTNLICLITIVCICLFLSILSFFLFKKRKFQIFINKINILSNIIYILILFYTQLNKYLLIIFFFFILLCIYILYLTNKAIKGDIELIDSINRIR
ncbi:DUF4293 family protein [Blattabacterium cuenoti]|uniref:DUF4293 family protein n=1 Tax=Blattabacterium cuenoti TaxID=1653831 RepID=UPI00163C3BAE|nr:DUF4293 family protein [Blattabacterium cuenoti]